MNFVLFENCGHNNLFSMLRVFSIDHAFTISAFLINILHKVTMSTKMSQEAKKDEFRKYLEKAGVLELLTKSLVQLYEVKQLGIKFFVLFSYHLFGI